MNYKSQKASGCARMRSGVSSMAAGGGVECLKSVKGVILDMCGVLYDSGEAGGEAIAGSVHAVRRSAQLIRLLINTADVLYTHL